MIEYKKFSHLLFTENKTKHLKASKIDKHYATETQKKKEHTIKKHGLVQIVEVNNQFMYIPGSLKTKLTGILQFFSTPSVKACSLCLTFS